MTKYTKYLVLCGTMFINSTLCVSYIFGNLSTYIYSLQYSQGRQNSTDIDISWMLPVYLVTKVLSSFIADFAAKKIGLKLTMVCGIIMSLLSTFLTYFTIVHSIWASTLTLTFLGGFGNHVLFVGILMYVAGWFKDGVGLANSMPFSAGALGGVLVNQIITAYINPWNLSPDKNQGEILYFSQPEIIERIPVVFLVVGCFTATAQIIGFCMLRTPPQTEEKSGEKSALLESQGGLIYEGSQQGNNEVLSASGKSTHSKEESTHLTLLSSSVKVYIRDRTEENRHKSHSDIEVTSEPEPVSLTPLQLLKSEEYYLMECVVAGQAIAYLIVVNYYKLFGQLWINDDTFLAVVGSTLALCVIPCFLICGTFLDRFGIKTTLIAHLATSSVFLCFWYFTANPSRWLYLVWTIVLYCLQYNLLIVFPFAALKLFGRGFYAANFGLIQLASLILYFVIPPIITVIISTLGWFWLFFISGAICFCAILPVLLRLPAK